MTSLGEVTLNLANKFESMLAGLKKGSLTINGIPTHFLQSKKVPEAPTLVLLHGFSADKYIWNRFAKHVSGEFNLLVPDMLGHGNNNYNRSSNYSVPQQVQHLIRLLNELNIETCIPIGNSMGGMMVAQMLKIAPERVLKAVLIDPAGAKTEFAQYMHESKHNPFIHSDLNQFWAFYKSSMHRPPYIPKYVINHVGQKYINNKVQYAHMFADFFNIDDFFTDKSFENQKPCLLIWGAKDELLPLDDHKLWEKILDSSALIYENIGHMPMVECPEVCANDIKLFLNTI